MTRSAPSASRRIIDEVASWPGVVAGPGARGRFSFRVGRTEIGHLHGDYAAHVALPRAMWPELLEQGHVVPHPIDHDGLASHLIEDEGDVEDAILLMRLNYVRLTSPPDLSIEAALANHEAVDPPRRPHASNASSNSVLARSRSRPSSTLRFTPSGVP